MPKLKPLYLLAILLLTAFATWKLTLVSRYQSSKITLLTIKRLDSSLNAANEIMQRSNAQIIAVFDQKLRDPITVEKAKIWSPIMNAAIEQTDRIVHQIEALKTQLKKEASLEIFDGKERYHEDDIDAATRLMINQGEGRTLMDSLLTFYTRILSPISKERRDRISMLPVSNLFEQEIDSYFKSTPAIAAIALLTEFQNVVLRSGNIIADFCSSQVPISYSDGYFDRFATLITQNATNLLPGETLEIKAGVGAFSTASKPVITINNKLQIINDSGFATYKIKVVDKDGKIAVSISYTDPNTGQTTTRSKQVSYTVTKQ